MRNENVTIQEQKAVQQQRLSAYQMLQVKLLEMPLPQLEETIRAELDDNPALDISDKSTDDDSLTTTSENNNDQTPEGGNIDEEKQEDIDSDTFNKDEERLKEIDNAFDSIDRDDRLPDYNLDNQRQYAADYEEIVYGNTTSFYDFLNEQMGEFSLPDTEKDILEYLIGSLDDDGYLRKPIEQIADELAIYHNIDTDSQTVNRILQVLQTFDPAGIGARGLQECLLLQIDRKIEIAKNEKHLTPDELKRSHYTLLRTIIEKHFATFKKKQWAKIADSMHLTREEMKNILKEVKRLNPRPGAALGETMGRSLGQITPDFIVDTYDDGTINIALASGKVPDLIVAPSFEQAATTTSTSQKNNSATIYAREKVERARNFIEAIHQRRTNMMLTMRARVELQRDYFLSGDDEDIHPMVLKDVAERCHLDISTISRVTNLKYVQTRWGIVNMRHFFSEGYVAPDTGEEMSTKKIKIHLRQVIDNEDKSHPLGDEALRKVMAEKGFPIARRTVTKYREQMGIPVARLRREIG